jgi:hypothetical protein
VVERFTRKTNCVCFCKTKTNLGTPQTTINFGTSSMRTRQSGGVRTRQEKARQVSGLAVRTIAKRRARVSRRSRQVVSSERRRRNSRNPGFAIAVAGSSTSSTRKSVESTLYALTAVNLLVLQEQYNCCGSRDVGLIVARNKPGKPAQLSLRALPQGNRETRLYRRVSCLICCCRGGGDIGERGSVGLIFGRAHAHCTNTWLVSRTSSFITSSRSGTNRRLTSKKMGLISSNAHFVGRRSGWPTRRTSGRLEYPTAAMSSTDAHSTRHNAGVDPDWQVLL